MCVRLVEEFTHVNLRPGSACVFSQNKSEEMPPCLGLVYISESVRPWLVGTYACKGRVVLVFVPTACIFAQRR